MDKSTHNMLLLPISLDICGQEIQKTRLSSIESEPKKVVVVAVVVVVHVFVFVVVVIIIVVVIIVGYRNLALKFGPNRVIYS